MFTNMKNLSVPGSDGGNDQSILLMPKLGYRFRVLFTSFGAGDVGLSLTRQVVSVARPQVNFPEIELPVYNSRIYLAGKPTWNPLNLVVRDDSSGDVQTAVGQQIQKQFDFQEQASAASGIDYKFTTRIEILDGGGGAITPAVLEAWECYGCYIADANYGEMNYGENNALQIALTIRFDNAVQSNLDVTGASIGGGIGRSFGAAAQRTINGITIGQDTPGTPG